MPVKINSLELENVKRIKAVKLEPTASGLTVVGGKNGQGKTSVLDSIAWALGGDSFAPSNAKREGSTIPPLLKITLSNGLVVERSGKNSSLKVIDPNGQKSGQNLLNSFIEKLALNLPKFMEMNNKDKARTMLKIIGVDQELYELENKEQALYNERLAIGQIADKKAKFAEEQIHYEGLPDDLISPSELIKQQQEILARNGRNQQLRNEVSTLEAQKTILNNRIEEATKTLSTLQEQLADLINKLVIANTNAKDLVDESTAELEESIKNIDETNAKIRKNLDKMKAEEEAKGYKDQYDNLTTEIEQVRKTKFDLLNGAELPYPGLSVDGGELTYNGQKWDNMSGSEQLKVATSIVRKINPECGFVLMDKLEQMDIETMNDFGKWLEQEGLQVIATRVSTGSECSVIIEDGYSSEIKENQSSVGSIPNWQKGGY